MNNESRNDAAPRGLRFRKMHGLGNDFVVIDARSARRGLDAGGITPALARRIADRRRGIGCDQIAVIGDGDGADAVEVAFWNPDGSRAGACGNATRCVASLLMRENDVSTIALRTAGGLLRAEAAGERVRVNMGRPVEDWRRIPLAREVDLDALPLDLGALSAEAAAAVGMGNPHCILLVPDAEAAEVERLGPRLEVDPLFPERTNVEFVQVMDPATIRMRVWERGSGVTLACGSGACAAAVATARRGLTDRQVTVLLDGGPLQIEWRAEGVWMTGPVAEVFEGVLAPAFLEAEA